MPSWPRSHSVTGSNAFAGSRATEGQHDSPHRKNDQNENDPHSEVLPRLQPSESSNTVERDRQDQGAQERANDISSTAAKTPAAEQHSGYGAKLQSLSRVGVSGKTRAQQRHAANCGQNAGRNKDEVLDAARAPGAPRSSLQSQQRGREVRISRPARTTPPPPQLRAHKSRSAALHQSCS
jgi:hypothetical protein